MKRLLFVVESGTDVRLVEGLAERFDLTVVARQIRGGREVSHPPEFPADIKVGPPGRSDFAIHVAREMRRRRRDFDAVIVQGYGAAALSANLAGRLSGLPVLMLVCSPVEDYYLCRKQDAAAKFHPWELAGLKFFARLNAKCGRGYVVLSRALDETVRGHHSRLPSYLVPVYGVDLSVFSPASDPTRRSALKAALGIAEERALILYPSRIAPEKDAQTLIEALLFLREDGREFHLLHRSGGFRAFAELARKNGLAKQVTATDALHPHRGLVDDYRAADVFVQASRAEGLGLGVLEALATELPVVAADVGGLRETVREGVTGWRYPVGNARALADALGYVMDHPDEARARARLGRAMVTEEYDRDRVFDRLERVVAGVISGPPGKS